MQAYKGRQQNIKQMITVRDTKILTDEKHHKVKNGRRLYANQNRIFKLMEDVSKVERR